MAVLEKLACVQGIRSDVPNQELAGELASKNGSEEISEIVENLWNKDKTIQGNCIKVLYEIGYIKPALIAGYVDDFIKLLSNKNNRLVWGGMIALSTIAGIKYEELFKFRDTIKDAIEKGSVITVDAGIITLSNMAACGEKYNNALFPYLIKYLKNCRPQSVAQYSESISVAVTEKNKSRFVKTVNGRKKILTPPQLKRVDKLFKKTAIKNCLENNTHDMRGAPDQLAD
ncbi:MAG: hypothetical protein P9L92_14005 [Candidatus Electryonea clarkiae]|nr:hypothetical protein [Candidatus Electryonea clarkiae]MDP8286188.1 hypothetical protein [Candidatus Electryonea clarkiae]